ncbi:hypothetical protein THMIRHAM_10460 [Thiomicrorhabdus immobilis]|uniref:DUF2986 domain-containing protein n=1 Tax=Thiomicrorhabdus immobilis TaxID=2791037 RepID=A0ABM7MCW9_9GAMM|nr:DUF2986 domain-containing protein [Thiomicrorhabdus immobilis]BCN93261.1 hypothetical protein THMIRHAM_10460 [Thiomicrorhabdus immobilis]
MNRQKKIRQKFEKKLKKAKAKRFPKNKEPYIAKADRIEVNQEIDDNEALLSEKPEIESVAE